MKTLILLAFMLITNVFAGKAQETYCGDKSLSYCINHFDRQCKAKNYFACWVVGTLHYEQEQYSQAKKYFEMVCDKANSGDSFQSGRDCALLGMMYNLGEGVKQNLSKAKELFGKACDLGEQKGCDEYKELKEKGY